MNNNKIVGLLLSLLGVCMARVNAVVDMPEGGWLFILRASGTAIALAGILVFAAGMRTRVKKVKACPKCCALNDEYLPTCTKCKTDL